MLNNSKSVAILMGTYQGEKYISEQLDSLAAQIHTNWRLIVSDDGSTDGTLGVLLRYQALWGLDKLEIRQGPQKGFAHNFLSMACDPLISADYYAFCDQDDVWLPEKLNIAISCLEEMDRQSEVNLYCGRTAYVRNDLKIYAKSPLFVFPPCFRNALIQSIAGGNTMVFNQGVKGLLDRAGVRYAPSHDWWVYQLVTGSGGSVFYDSNPYILYRQHEESIVGGNVSLLSQIERIMMVVMGRFKLWSDQNIQNLQASKVYLTKDAIEIIALFTKLRTAKRVRDRLRLVEVCGLYRQTWQGTLSMVLAAVLKRL